MPRVALVSSVYPPEIGGPSLQTRDIADTLVSMGHEVCVVTTTPAAPGVDAGEERFPVKRLHIPLKGWSGKVRRNARFFKQVFGILAEFRPDVVHVQGCDGNLAFIAGASARSLRLPRLVKFSADLAWSKLNIERRLGIPYEEIHTSSLRARAVTAFQRLIFAQYDLIWSTSPYQSDVLRKVYGVADERIFDLPNLVNLPACTKREETGNRTGFLALVVARAVPWKGIDIAIRALHLLRSTHGLPLRLRVVGGGTPSYLGQLARLARDLDVADAVELIGSVHPTSVADELAAADIFLLPSVYEPFGIALVEAMSCGLPIVASRTGGIPSVIEDGDSGLLSDPGDHEDLAEQIARLLRDHELRRHISDGARRRASHFDLRERAHDLTKMYRTIAPGVAAW